MLPMPSFEVESPESIAAVVRALAAPNSRLLAGGTDLLPTLKKHLAAPERVVSLHRVAELREMRLDEDAGILHIGAGMTLAHLASDERVTVPFPSFARAIRSVASPQIRNRATLGGNLHLDTRCRYVNQSPFWRGALGGCLKAEGDTCHVVPGGKKCVAALSADSVPILVALGAELRLVSAEGERTVALEKYYTSDGVRHVGATPGELCVTVLVPMPKARRRTAYVKWRPRASIDFPLVSVALRFDLDEDGAIFEVHVVAGALAAKPRRVRIPESIIGRRVDDPEVATLVADAAFAQCKPLANVPYDPAYRRKMIRVLTRRAIQGFADEPG